MLYFKNIYFLMFLRFRTENKKMGIDETRTNRHKNARKKNHTEYIFKHTHISQHE